MTRYCYRIFNTNNLWVSMSAMKSVVEKHFLHMEIIINPKVWFWSIALRFVIDYVCCFSTVNEQFLHGTSVHYSLLSAIGIVVCWWYCVFKVGHILIVVLTHTHPFKGPGTTRVSQYQKGKTNLDFTEARDSEWQWHQPGHMQVCTPPLSFFTGRMPFLLPNQQRQSTEGTNSSINDSIK